MNTAVQMEKPPLCIDPVFRPRNAVDSGRRIPLERGEGMPKQIDVDMVQECSEPLLLLVPCCLSYTLNARGHALPARCPERAWSERVSLGLFPWLRRLRLRSCG